MRQKENQPKAYQDQQQGLAEKLQAMPEQIKTKAIDALGGFASGFLSGYEAAKAEEKQQTA